MASRIREILIATNNPSKFKEIVAVLSEQRGGEPVADSDLDGTEIVSQVGDVEVRWRSLADLPAPIPEPHEDEETCEGNAALKARAYSNAAGMWALADDSGLEVDALNGEPGVHSAYYDRVAAHLPRAERDRANNAKLIAALRDIPADRRNARFRCCLTLADGDRILATAVGTVEGRIVDEPRGSGGFGYDPHFFILAMGKTTAELTPREKNRISHRGQALRAMGIELQAVLGRLR